MERDRYRGEPANRFAQSPWNRPPPRSFNPRGSNGRARTPSPGASYGHRDPPRGMDVRDRLDLDIRAGPSRPPWDPDRDRRWNGRDERFGDESRPPNRRPSPTKMPFRERPSSPHRWRSSSIPRNGPPASRPVFGQREREWERDRPGSGQDNRDFSARSPGPPSICRDQRQYPPSGAEAGSTRSSPGAASNGAARSARGTSSPVMSSRIPEPTPIPPKVENVKSEPEEGELEEGEVLSPVRVPREPVRESIDNFTTGGPWNRNRQRRSSPPIGLGRKPSNVPGPRGYRGRPPHVAGGDRERSWATRHVSPTKGPVDNGWNGFARRRVSAEEPVSRGSDRVPSGDLASHAVQEEGQDLAKDEPTTPPIIHESSMPPNAQTEEAEAADEQTLEERPVTPERPPTPPLPALSEDALAVIAAAKVALTEEAEIPPPPVVEATLSAVDPVADALAHIKSEALPLTTELETLPATSQTSSSTWLADTADMSVVETATSPPKVDGDAIEIDTGVSFASDSAKIAASHSTEAAATAQSLQTEEAIPIESKVIPEARLVPGDHDAHAQPLPTELASGQAIVADEIAPTQTAITDTAAAETAAKINPPASSRLPERRAAETRTLAERRSVQLPPTSGPLPPSLVQSDAMPTAMSESTETEIWTEPVAEEVRDANLYATIKSAQSKHVKVDAEAIMAWNVSTSPVKTRKVLLGKELKDIIRSLDKGVSKRVAMQIAKEQAQNERRVTKLREEYLQLDRDWQEHCRYLDEIMEERGPPPDSLYSIPNAIPAVTPGPMPSTPAVEEVGGRRRRGGLADAVNTEAEFQEILAAMADTAAKDPHYRAAKTTAVVPDMLTPKERLLRHVDENDLVDDPLAFYDFEGVAEAIWTQEEEDVFKRRYLNHPKQFGKIADGIPTKTAGDCVLYYYRTKKDKNWKGQLAMRRGMSTQKRKAPLIKKGGKSAALLANLDAKKPTVDATPVKPASKDAADASGKRKPKEPRRKSTLVTPVSTPAAEEDEVPEMGIKKVRGKGKRPRVSTIEQVTEVAVTATAPTEAGISTELLPPVKRRKHRKVVPEMGPDGQPVPIEERPAKPKRGPTNSYWAKGEKERVKELAATYKTDYKAIASFMPEKTERQIMNHMRDHLVEWGLAGESGKPSGPFSRSIYDVYSGSNGGPRLGVFPPLPRPEATPAPSQVQPPATVTDTPVHISRPGGMRISALLNDDPLPPRVDNTDNQSDVTVDEEDPRRSPVSYAQAPQVAQSRHESSYPRPSGYRRVSSGSYHAHPHPRAEHVHVDDKLLHRYPETMARHSHVPYGYDYAPRAYEQTYESHSSIPPHSDAYRSMMAERAYNRANVAVDYRSPQPQPTYDRWHDERAQRERTYAAAAAMPPLHHPQPHHSHLHSHPASHSHTPVHPHPHHHPSHSHPARSDSSQSHHPSMSPHVSHAHAMAAQVQRMSPHMQAGMLQHRSPFEPDRVTERLPSIHSVIDDRRE